MADFCKLRARGCQNKVSNEGRLLATVDQDVPSPFPLPLHLLTPLTGPAPPRPPFALALPPHEELAPSPAPLLILALPHAPPSAAPIAPPHEAAPTLAHPPTLAHSPVPVPVPDPARPLATVVAPLALLTRSQAVKSSLKS